MQCLPRRKNPPMHLCKKKCILCHWHVFLNSRKSNTACFSECTIIQESLYNRLWILIFLISLGEGERNKTRPILQTSVWKHKIGKPRAQTAYYCKVSSSEGKIKHTKLMKCLHIHNEMKELTHSDRCFEANFITCLGTISTWH